jgi:drug/metabolite transporter (DMT)-like permease
MGPAPLSAAAPPQGVGGGDRGARSSSSSPPPPPGPCYIYGTLFAWIALSILLIFINKEILGFTSCRFPFLLAFLHMATGGAAASWLVRRRRQAAERGAAAATTAPPPPSAGATAPKDIEACNDADDTACLERDGNDNDCDGNSDDSFSSTASASARPAQGAADAPSPSSSSSSPGLERDYFLVAAFFTCAVVCANGAFMFVSIPMIQMLKAASPAVTFFASVALGAEAFSAPQLLNVLVICAGVLTAVYASVEAHALGIGLQVASIVCDSLRVSLLQRTMARAGAKMDPMAALANFAPRAAVLLVLPMLIFDLPVVAVSPLCLLQSWHLIMASCAVAFLLNVAVCALILATSALTTSVSGGLRDVACILLAMALHDVHVTRLQWGGYAVSLAGLAWHHYRNVFGRVSVGGGVGGVGGSSSGGSAPSLSAPTAASIGNQTELAAWRKGGGLGAEDGHAGDSDDEEAGTTPLLLERGGGGGGR